jgi:hypothetical protein
MHFAAMSTLDPNVLAERLQAIEASYGRQLSLTGKTVYDPLLAVFIYTSRVIRH